MATEPLTSNHQLPEFTYEQIVEGKRPPVLSGPYIPAYLVKAEIKRLTREHLAEAAAHDTTRRERAEDVKEVSRLRAALGAALSGAIRYVGYDCADCGMQVLEGRSVCRKSGNPHTPPKNGLGSSAADEIERLRAALGRAKDQIKHSDNRCVCHEVYLILEDAQTLRGADETNVGI